ncbi:hypothetical protein DASC09_024900 [Saccharomycopsis crataegensis]|uniref:Major facilitator superfamily (MFS) profile domain-containing protein n=1 Tax=Saccharomycopsis crataegensis TaxID=43959 RepID=A0AAV5QLF1_9ASCO|nr:hypothetical protein DASC09_024900 [Saccharomycopsis crataegensis]
MSDEIKQSVSHIEDAADEKPTIEEASTAEVFIEPSVDAKIATLKEIVGPDRVALEKKLVRRLDYMILPALQIIYILNYLDRTNIGTARLGTLEEDTNLHGTQYNTVIAIFFVGYVLMQVFTNLLLNKVRPSIFLPCVMICWATVSACSGAVQSYGGWIAVRFILGFVESPFFAGSVFLLSSWYTKKELASRIALMYVASQMSGAFGGLIGEAILGRFSHDNLGIAAWRWLFIIEGVITIPVAICAMFILPDFPHNTKWLSEQERALAQLRIIEEANREDNYETQSLKKGFTDAFKDPALYMIWILQLSICTAAGVNAYFPTIVQTLGYGRTKTLLLTVPPWIVSALWSIATCFSSDKHKERFGHIMVSLVIALVGFIIAASTMNIAARYVSMIMMLMIYGGLTTAWSWASTTLSRPPAKRAVSIAFINAFSNISSTYSSYFYPKSSGPRYLQGMALNIGFTALAIVFTIITKAYLVYRNKKLQQANEEDLAVEGKRGGSKSTALADKWYCDPHYRFTT